jgi:anti-sigma regulatory factor (Ser/Thr protein kinase)
MRTLKRRYPSKFASVSKARREVASFARMCGLAAADVSDIALAAGEACNNAAEHGHVLDGFFSVTCCYENGEFAVEVADDGTGFDPTGKGECLHPERLGLRGLGIFIMRSLMDDVCFSMGASGTCVHMLKVVTATQPEFDGVASRHAVARVTNGRLGAMHDRIKTLLELARVQMSSRRKA